MQPSPKAAMQLQLLLLASACATLLVAARLSPSHDVELKALAGSVRRAGVHPNNKNDDRDRQRLSLRHLESMWHTSLGKEFENSSSEREEVFRAAVDSEWELLASRDDVGGGLPEGESLPSLRSPFLVCTDRHPDAILALENVVHRTRTQLAYSRGDTACLLAGLRLNDVETLRESEGVHVVEPLPHPAKLSRSLHAMLEPFDEGADGSQGDSKASTASEASRTDNAVTTGIASAPGAAQHGDAEAAQMRTGDAQPLPRNVRFNHGEGLPSGLDVSLTPGTWGIDLAETWTEHLASFGSTACLWDDHLRERFLWTRSALHTKEGVVSSGDGKGQSQGKDGEDSRARRDTLVKTHGLTHVGSLWEQTVEHSSKDGACDFGRLRASSEEAQNVAEEHNEGNLTPRHRRGGSGRSRKGGTRSANVHDRVVIQGADSLGNTPKDNAHCLLTVLAYLATRPEVAYVDDFPEVIPFNVEAAWVTQSGKESTYSVWDQGIDGRTEIIAMADSGLDQNSCFFREDSDEENIECSSYTSPVYDLTKRKVVQYVAFVDCVDNENGHGTHVGGSAAGALSHTSPGEHFGDGSGFRAKLAVFDFGNDEGNLVTPSNLKTQMLDPPYDIGARVSTNSWGAVRTTYTSLDRQMDTFAYIKPDMAIIVAAGNCGDAISQCAYQGADIYGAGSILSPALAKNVITVGASEASPSSAGLADDLNEVAYFSSQGPTVDDNRIKPDVVAPGYHLFSASAKPDDGETCEIGPMAGTSMATPIVAGTAAMVRQYFIQGWYPSGIPTPSDVFNPSNALVKATIIASGTDMASYDGSSGSTTLGTAPDGIQGFGRVLLDSVLNMHGSVDLFVEDAIDMTHGDVHSYMLEMDDISSSAYDGDMKVTMVWMEPAGYTSSVAPVFNDLDLQVVAYDGTTETIFYPNNLAAKDPDNTVEMVRIPDVDLYQWFNVTVTGASVTTTSLPYYALVVTGGVAGNYSPTSATGRSWFVRWEMTFEGVPVVEAATAAFEAALAEAISAETGDYTVDNSTVLVKIDRSEAGTTDNENDDADADTDPDNDSTVTVEISVDSETDGYAILTYVLSVVEGSSASSSGSRVGLTEALNAALESRTTTGCICVALSSSYDCSACEEGAQFSTVGSVKTAQGGYDLLSTESSGSGHSPVSALESAESEEDDDAFWSDFAGGKQIQGVIRTDTYGQLGAVVGVIVLITCLSGYALRWLPDSAEAAASGAAGASQTRGSAGLASSPMSVTDRKRQQVQATMKRNAAGRASPFTPGPTPARGSGP